MTMTRAIGALACALAIAGAIVQEPPPNELDRDDPSNLRLVSVVFRHGDRAPDPAEMFPTDPHQSFYPEGPGGLTIAGKRRLYKLGELLRLRYDHFLGDACLPDSVFARSTDYPRTKMCLQLVLASLYPPRMTSQLWNANLLWQPVPTVYVDSKRDWLMIPENCPQYMAERARVEGTPEVREKIESFRGFMDKLTGLTGKEISKPVDMFNLYHLMTAERAMNLTLPGWTDDVFPSGRLLEGTYLEYEIFSHNRRMRRLNGGKLLYAIMKDMKMAMVGEIPKNRRIALYSGHETNVAAVLQALGIFEPHVPAYSSAVLFELHAINNEYYVKVVRYLGIPSEFVVQRIPGCEELCPFRTFSYLLRDVIPTQNELDC
ncbi:venom acid phosphatase Acph-1-like isoform X2 [Copidosoma floridanum]|uniref:venom acid phosphatase Acph-1-like isoform X2 n=1 Tax=Copidosoma floridanum TaxID=29053 RepID=UPI0006C9672E|nr:venom acid phosphatase Acph-1-like isoform X2 [Copidosoma floridanum]